MTEPLERRVARVVAEPVVVVAYDPAWPESFRRERERLLARLGPDLVGRIEHFGSTAVPGLAAKPVVDILVEVADLAVVRARVAPALEAEGYEYLWRPTYGDDVPPWYAWFIRRDASGARTHHVHMVEAGFAEHWDRLLVRDWLISHPQEARRYGALKTELARACGGQRRAYARGKKAYLDALTERARREA